MELYQRTVNASNKVGSLAIWREFDEGSQAGNRVDIAMFEPEPGVAAKFALHDDDGPHGMHAYRRWVVAGVKEPVASSQNPMRLTLVGARTGEKTVTVTATGQSRVLEGRHFSGLIKLDCSQSPVDHGDSGAPCLSIDDDGNYHMAGIFFAAEDDEDENDGAVGWAFPASVVERALLQSSIFDTDYSIIGILDRLRMQEHVGRMIRGFKQQSTDKDVWLTEAQARLLLAHIPYAFPELADEYAISQQSLCNYRHGNCEETPFPLCAKMNGYRALTDSCLLVTLPLPPLSLRR